MRVAVLTLTRDRLEYTQHCFTRLRELAGCEYDHFVLDQGSKDGTSMWLLSEYDLEGAVLLGHNIGCCRGWNMLLDVCDPSEYDAIVTFDNDCELLDEDTLATTAWLSMEHEVILSPHVRGLMFPPPAIGHFQLDDHSIYETAILGNIFMAIPARVFTEMGFRWDERYAVWDGGESVTAWYRDRGGRCGYINSLSVNHYKTTLGQVADIPGYFQRRVLEGGRAQ